MLCCWYNQQSAITLICLINSTNPQAYADTMFVLMHRCLSTGNVINCSVAVANDLYQTCYNCVYSASWYYVAELVRFPCKHQSSVNWSIYNWWENMVIGIIIDNYGVAQPTQCISDGRLVLDRCPVWSDMTLPNQLPEWVKQQQRLSNNNELSNNNTSKSPQTLDLINTEPPAPLSLKIQMYGSGVQT